MGNEWVIHGVAQWFFRSRDTVTWELIELSDRVPSNLGGMKCTASGFCLLTWPCNGFCGPWITGSLGPSLWFVDFQTGGSAQ
jgi:hypothetical protein